MQKDGTLKERIGTTEFIYTFSKTPDNKFMQKCISKEGLMIEESMNTIAEEISMANYMGISLEEMRNAYRESLVPSNYQGYMAYFVSYMLDKLGKDDFENYRLYGDIESKDKINNLMEKTDYWKNREENILPSSDSPISYDKKRAIISRIESENVRRFFSEYETIYFPDISKMTPLQKIDNILEQNYNMNLIKYSMGIDNYTDFKKKISDEGIPLINQTAVLKEKQKEEKESGFNVNKKELEQLRKKYKSTEINSSDLKKAYTTISKTKDEILHTQNIQSNINDFEER